MFKKGLNSNAMKMIAIITMLIDHFAAALLRYLIIYGYLYTQNWINCYYVLRGIGRIAFPIFAYMITEGFIHTSNRIKYARNLFIFALLSEIPFDLAFHKTIFETAQGQNVFFTLFLGLLAIWLVDTLIKKKYNKILEILGIVGITGVFCYIAYMMQTDYSQKGILTIVIYYLFNIEYIHLFKSRRLNIILGTIIICAILSYQNKYELPVFVDTLLIHFYNGQRGKRSTFIKYFFYLFYPLHLLLLSGIYYYLF